MATTTPAQTTTSSENTNNEVYHGSSENTNNGTQPGRLDEVYPTVTIIDNVGKKRKYRRACGCIPERTVVAAILSMYFFWGVIQAAASFSSLPLSSSAGDQAFAISVAIVSLILVIASAVGLNAMYKENAKLLRRLSIVFIILTVVRLAFSVASLVIDVVGRDDLIAECNQDFQQDTNDANGVDCNQLVNMALIREGLYLLFIEIIQIYFAYVIFRHAREMVTKTRYPYPLATPQNSDAPPTYFVYASQGVPTSDNWVPPPTYNGNQNNIPVSGDSKLATIA